MTGNRSGHSLQPDIGFLELFASANTKANIEANTCAYLSSITWLNQPSLSLFDETNFSITSLDQANQPCSTIQALRWYLSLMRPGCSSSRWTNNHYPTP